MAAGDLKGEECIVITVTAGAAVTKGQLVHSEADDFKWDPTADADKGKFGVAIEDASGDGIAFKCCIWGRVEVTASAAAIAKGALVMAGAGVVVATDHGVLDEQVGTAMEAFAGSDSQTVWIGLVN